METNQQATMSTRFQWEGQLHGITQPSTNLGNDYGKLGTWNKFPNAMKNQEMNSHMFHNCDYRLPTDQISSACSSSNFRIEHHDSPTWNTSA